MERCLKMGVGCIALLLGVSCFVCGIYTDIIRDGYGGIFFSAGFYAFWIWFGGYCFSSVGVQNDKIYSLVISFWFVGYICLLLRFTFFEPAYSREFCFLWSVSAEKRRVYLDENINLIPFASLKLFLEAMYYGYLPYSACLVNIFGNLAVFAPMPLFLIAFMGKKKLLFGVVGTLITVIFVEILQVLTMCGSADVDDLLLNMTGTVISTCFAKRFLQNLRYK